MQKHFLLTVSDDRSALYGARFVNAFFSNKDQVKFTLLYIAPRTGQRETLVPVESESNTCDLALEDTVQRLMDWDFLEENLLCKVKKRMVSTSKDIITEGNRGLYDAIILGRRGTSRIEELINDSVSVKLLKGERNAPIWVCRNPETDRRNVLVCLDGSRESLHITDHVGFILADELQHQITLLHVQTSDRVPDSLFEDARQVLDNYSIARDRVQERLITSKNPAKAILTEAEKGRFSAVAVGYSGEAEKSVFRMGSVGLKLFYEMQGSVLWVG